MYEMLTGVTPFQGSNRMELLNKINNKKVVFPSKEKYSIEYSDEFADIIL